LLNRGAGVKEKARCAASKKIEAQNKIAGKCFLLQANAFFFRQTLFFAGNAFHLKK
jgi:hypothetical protein